MKILILIAWFLFCQFPSNAQEGKIESEYQLNRFLRSKIGYQKSSIDSGYGGYSLIKATLTKSSGITSIETIFTEDSLFATEIKRVLKKAKFDEGFTQKDTVILLIPVYFSYINGRLKNEYIWNEDYSTKRRVFLNEAMTLKDVVFIEPVHVLSMGNDTRKQYKKLN